MAGGCGGGGAGPLRQLKAFSRGHVVVRAVGYKKGKQLSWARPEEDILGLRMGRPGEPPLTAHDWGGDPWGGWPGLGWGETRVVGTTPDLEDRLWAVLVPVPSGELEGMTPEKDL